MSDTTATNLFIGSSLNRHTGFYQQLIGGMSDFKELANSVVVITEQAQAFRQYDKVDEMARILINLPIKPYQAIGHYYLGLCEYRSGKNPQEIFERVADEAPIAYRVRAMQSLAAIEARKQDYASELRFFTESLKMSPSVESLWAIAIVKAKEGYHRQAVNDFESLYSLAQHAPPHIYFNYLNSFAVELCEVGRLQEAKNISQLVCRSPFAPFYKEWQETLSDVNHKLYKSRSTVRITRPIQYHSEEPSPADTAKVLPFPSQHAKSAEQFDPFGYSQPKTEVDKVLEFDTKELEATICNWVNGEVSAEELASVFMSLQSFKDAARIKDMLDKMIHYIYLQTPEAKEAEAKWRSRIYVKLKPSDMDTD